MKVVITYDNATSRAELIRELERGLADAQYVTAADQNEFERLLLDPDVGLFVVPYQMAWSDGLELVRLIRRRRPLTPVLMATAYGSEDIAIEAFRAGVTDYIPWRHLDHLGAIATARLERSAPGDKLDTEDVSFAEMSRVDRQRLHEAEVSALLTGTRAILDQLSFQEAAASIYQACQSIIGSQAGYIALSDRTGAYNDLVFLDDGPYACSVDPELPMPIRGMREAVYRSGRTMYHNGFSNTDWAHLLPDGHVSLDSVLFSPLIVDGQTLGLLGLANKPSGFTDADAAIATAFADLAAVALQHSRTSERLVRSEERFRQFVEQSPAGVGLIDASGHIVAWNAAQERITGLAREDVVGSEAGDVLQRILYSGECKQGGTGTIPQWMATICAGGEAAFGPQMSEYSIRHPDGRIVFVQTTLFPIEIDHNYLLGVYAWDITDQHVANRERERLLELNQQQRELLERLVSAAPLGIAVVSGPDHHHELANTYYSSISGAQAPIIGRPFVDAFPALHELGVTAILDQVLRTGEAVQLREHGVALGRDRALTYWDVDHIPLKDMDGRVARILIVAHEVTQLVKARHRAERLAKEVRRERDALHAIMHNTHVSLAYLDPEFNFIDVNTAYAQNSGHTRVELIGRNHFDLFANPENEAIFRRVRDRAQPIAFLAKPFEFPDQPERGVTYWDWSLAPVVDTRGDVSGLVLSLLDVTERETQRRQQETYLTHLRTLIQVTEQLLAERTVDGLVQRVVDAARLLTGARQAVSGHGFAHGVFRTGIVSHDDQTKPCPPSNRFSVERGGVYLRLLNGTPSFRFSDAELRDQPDWQGLPESHAPINGLLGARLIGRDGRSSGLIMASNKAGGDFTAEDEALVVQLAALASLGLGHIEAREQAEHRAIELDTIITSIADGVAIFSPEGDVLRMNEAAMCALSGVVFTGDYTDPNQSMLLARGQPIRRALDGEIISGQVIEWKDHPRRGHMWIAVSASPIVGAGNNPVGAVAVFTDVTELRDVQERLRQANEELERQAEALRRQAAEMQKRNVELERLTHEIEDQRRQLNTIIENAPEGIVVIDQTGRVVMTNPAADRLAAGPLSEPVDAPVEAKFQLVKPDGTPYDRNELPLTWSAIRGEVSRNVELAIGWPDGQERHLLVNTAPIHTMRHQITGAIGVFQDITLRKRAEQALEQRTQELALLNAVGRELSGTLDLERVLDRIMQATAQVLTVTGCSVWLVDADNPRWLICRASTPSPRDGGGARSRVRFGEGIAGWVAEHGESITTDLHEQETLPIAGATERAVLEGGIVLAAPLRARGRLIGVMEAVRALADPFDDHDQMLLGTVAAWAAIAIENALLHQQAQYTAVAAERTRLASELHDAVSQLLFSASVVAESLPRLWDDNPEAVWRGLNQLQGLTRGALAEMRTLLLELRPSALLEADLGNVLGQLTQAMAGRGRMHIELHLEGEGQVPEEAQIALYRIAQEALNNVVKHARAQRVDVTLRRLPERVELIITDDGRGFEPDRVLPSSLGLRILRERADAIGADVDIDTDVGRGTRVTVRWPQALESEE